jgi:hypothetical protein
LLVEPKVGASVGMLDRAFAMLHAAVQKLSSHNGCFHSASILNQNNGLHGRCSAKD